MPYHPAIWETAKSALHKTMMNCGHLLGVAFGPDKPRVSLAWKNAAPHLIRATMYQKKS